MLRQGRKPYYFLMAWTTAETENAKYVLVFSTHFTKTEPVAGKFDAVILESVSEIPAISPLADRTVSAKQYRKIVSDAAKQGKDIWILITAWFM